MKKFFIGLLKAIGYFGIYFGMQILVSTVYSIAVVVPVVVEYIIGGYDLTDPAILEQYMNDIMQPVLEATMALTIISGILTLGLLWLIFVCRKKKFAKEIGLRKISFWTIPPIFLMGLGFNVLTGVVLSALPESWLGSYEETSSMAFMGEYWVTFLGTAIVAPIVEEVIFRGLAYSRMKKGMPTVWAVILTSVLFGVAHGHPVWMLYTFVFGLLLIWVLERTKSLVAPMVLHIGYNLCAVLQMLLPADAPDWAGIALIAAAAVVAAIGIIWFLLIPKVPAPAEDNLPANESTAIDTIATDAEETVKDIIS